MTESGTDKSLWELRDQPHDSLGRHYRVDRH